MSLLRPELIALRREIEHAKLRLERKELMATAGRVDFSEFQFEHGYLEGAVEAFDVAWRFLTDPATALDQRLIPEDLAVVLLIVQGEPVETVAERCGFTVDEVAAVLASFVSALPQPEPEGDDT